MLSSCFSNDPSLQWSYADMNGLSRAASRVSGKMVPSSTARSNASLKMSTSNKASPPLAASHFRDSHASNIMFPRQPAVSHDEWASGMPRHLTKKYCTPLGLMSSARIISVAMSPSLAFSLSAVPSIVYVSFPELTPSRFIAATKSSPSY